MSPDDADYAIRELKWTYSQQGNANLIVDTLWWQDEHPMIQSNQLHQLHVLTKRGGVAVDER